MIRTLLTAAALLAVTPAVARDVSKFGDSTFNSIAAGTLALQAGGITCADGATCDVTQLSVAPKGFTPKALGAWLSPAGVQSLLNGVLPNLGTNIFGDSTNRPDTWQPGVVSNVGWGVYQPVGGDTPAFRAQRAVPSSYVGVEGTKKTIWSLTTTGQNEIASEWGILGELHNRTARPTAGNVVGQHVAVAGTAFVEENGTDRPTSTTWGGNFNCTSKLLNGPLRTPCVGAEVDAVTSNGGKDPFRQLVGLQVSIAQFHPEIGPKAPGHGAYGILVGAGENMTVDRAISLRGSGKAGIGLDTVKQQFTGPAILLGSGQKLAFDGDPTADQNGDGAYSRYLSSVSGNLVYTTPRGTALQVTDAGQVQAPSAMISGTTKTGSLVVGLGTPASASASCTQGQFTFDSGFFYACVGTNTWKRAALSSW